MITTCAVGDLVKVNSEGPDREPFTFLLSIQEALDLSCELANAVRKAQLQKEILRYGCDP